MNQPRTSPSSDAAVLRHLRHGAEGSYTMEAAVGLLIAHGVWLDQPELRLVK